MNNKIVCHSPSERCYGCDHYHGKADVCKYAPEMTDEKIKPVARLMVWKGRGTWPVKGYTVARTYEECAENFYILDWEESTKLYPEAALAQAREEGKIAGLREAADELAAKECEQSDKSTHPSDLAEAIRKLKEQS
jgi:hypothetical protein